MPFRVTRNIPENFLIPIFVVCVAFIALLAAVSPSDAESSSTALMRSTKPCSVGCEWGPTVSATLLARRAQIDAYVAEVQRQAAERVAAEAAAQAEAEAAAEAEAQQSYSNDESYSSGSSDYVPTEGHTPCAIPSYICTRESGGDPTIYNPSGDASGKYQFIRSTWDGYGGYTNAADAPEEVQDAKATELWAGGAGCSHWSAC